MSGDGSASNWMASHWASEDRVEVGRFLANLRAVTAAWAYARMITRYIVQPKLWGKDEMPKGWKS